MKATQRIVIAGGLALLGAGRAVMAEQGADGASWLQFIAAELRQLRIELLEQQLAIESGKLAEIEQAVAALRTEQNQAKTEDRAHQQQIADLDRQMENPGTDAESRAQMQTLRTELATAGAARLQAAQAAAAARDSTLAERLRGARVRMDALTARLKALTAPQR